MAHPGLLYIFSEGGAAKRRGSWGNLPLVLLLDGLEFVAPEIHNFWSLFELRLLSPSQSFQPVTSEAVLNSV